MKQMRLSKLDLLRGIAVLLMIQEHLLVWLWKGPSAVQGWPSDLAMAMAALGGLAAPLFIGISAFVQQKFSQAPRKLWVRGVILLAIAYALNLAVSQWFTSLSWYVLHLLALGLLLSPWLGKCSARSLWLLGGIVLVLGPFLRGEFQGHWLNAQMNGSWVHGDYLIHAADLALWQSFFPIFPWLAFWIWSMAMAQRPVFSPILPLFLALSGGLLWVCGHFSLFQYPLSLWTEDRLVFYPLAVPLFMLLFAQVHYLIALFSKDGVLPRPWLPIERMGKNSLSLFVFHIVLFRQGLPAMGYFHQLSAWQSLGFVFGFLSLLYVIFCLDLGQGPLERMLRWGPKA